MTQKSAQDMVAANASIWEHYKHACEKHPRFADGICLMTEDWEGMAADAKEFMEVHEENGLSFTATIVLMGEIYEALAAYCAGDLAQARYEIMDAIAVLLRMDDMLAGMQEREER